MRKRLFRYDAVRELRHAALLLCLLVLLPVLGAVEAAAETRTLKLYNTHTKERVEVTFKKNGRYIPGGLREANRFLRDWRRNEITNIDPKLLDLVWEVYQQVGASKPIYVVSSYRSPATNNMLRKRSRGVAKNSQHTLGKAMDFYIPGVNLATLRATGLRKEIGGVGYYPTSGSPFVHMDTGRVRHWPKMTRSQLAKVFPDGKTLHIPSDGKPLKGYKLALAEAKSGKRSSSKPTLVASNSAPERPASTTGQSLRNSSDVIRPAATNDRPASGNLLASLFGNNSDDNSERTRVAAVRPGGAPVPPGALPGVRRSGDAPSSPGSVVSPVIDAPPIPLEKDEADDDTTEGTATADEQDRVVLAGIVPASKPSVRTAAVQVASAAPGTLDAQRQALESGQPNLAASERFDIASLPSQKPAEPAQNGSDDPLAAILAATGGPTPGQKPTVGGTQTALAYASATATPANLTGARPSAPAAPAALQQPAKAPTRSVSGRIPLDQIRDPLAGFAGLPDKSEPRLISGAATTRNRMFASLSHPKQRTLRNFLTPGNRFVAGGFELFPYGALRTDRFEGPAVVVLPVTFAK